MSVNLKTERNPALCIRCQPHWRRWVRLRSRQLGINESSLIELACSWYAQRCDFPSRSPSIWYPETNPRWVDQDDEDRYKDAALYLNVTEDWKSWIASFARSQHRSTSWLIEVSLYEYSKAQGASLPPPRTKFFTHVIR